MTSSLGIVIVNWRNKKVILDCLVSIAKAGYLANVVVVDNGSDDGTIEELRIKNYESRIKVIKNKQNLGFAEGNNVGIRYLLSKGTKYILILNPDTLIDKKMIKILLDEMEKDETIGIAGPKILSPNGYLWSCGGILDKKRYSGGLIGLNRKDNGQDERIKEVDYISGTAMMIKRAVFEKIGLFEKKYFIYYEDVELSLLAKKAGFKVVFVPWAVMHHLESSSFGKDSPAHEYYMARNHLQFVERNAPLIIKIREIVRLPKTIYEHAKRREKHALLGIRDFFLRRWGRRDYWS